MASKFQREYDAYVARGRSERSAEVVAAAKAEGDPVAEVAKPARKRGEKGEG